MEYRAIHRHARIAPRKARLVADLIRGMNVDEALNALGELLRNPRETKFIYLLLPAAAQKV